MKTSIFIGLAIIAAFAVNCKRKLQEMPREYNQPTAPSEEANQQAAGQPEKFIWPPVWDEKQDGPFMVSENLLAKNYFVILDSSGSMSEGACNSEFGTTKSQVAKSALMAFAGQVPADANLGFMVFENAVEGAEIKERLSLGVNNRDAFRRAVDETTPQGGTPLYEAVLAGLKSLTRQAQKQLGYGEYFLVVVTDGEANPGHEPDRVVDFIVEKTPVTLYTIGFCIGSHHTLNRPGVTFYREANNPNELAAALQQVLAESPEFKDMGSFQQQ
ncbi:VWA domain-containing protein [Candidatus Falkowbacteria bacterium]|nr:VWA domain-containing protein [Candidatus Falkowbacteria bacterium]